MHRVERESRSRYLEWRGRCFAIGIDGMSVVEMVVRWLPVEHMPRADSGLRSVVRECRCAVVVLDWEQLR
jgi:hypothetical protein